MVRESYHCAHSCHSIDMKPHVCRLAGWRTCALDTNVWLKERLGTLSHYADCWWSQCQRAFPTAYSHKPHRPSVRKVVELKCQPYTHLEAAVTTVTCQSCVPLYCLNFYVHHWSNHSGYITQKPSKQQLYIDVKHTSLLNTFYAVLKE